MAGRGGPSFLKRQKEQARTARQNAKRATQQARRDDRAAGIKPEEDLGELLGPESMMQDYGAESEPGAQVDSRREGEAEPDDAASHS